jgi:phosphonate transport system permease protein
MVLDEIKRKTRPFNLYNLVITLVFLTLLTWSWNSTEMSVKALLQGWHHMVVYVGGNPDLEGSGFFPPAVNASSMQKYLFSMLETVQMAFLALIISVAVAFPLGFFASRNTLEIIFPGNGPGVWLLRKILYGATRFVANMARSINELVWALIFVSAVGLGPMAGILALGIHTSGVLIKLFSEGIEAIQSEPVEALTATGSGFIKVDRKSVV